MTLFELDNELKTLLEQGFNEACIDMETGEIDMEKASFYLDTIKCDREQKLDNYGRLIKNLIAEAEALKQQEKAFKDRRTAKENKIKALKEAVRRSMMLADEKKFETINVAYSLRRSESVEVPDATVLPIEYRREKIIIEAAKDEIKKAIKKGVEINGAILVENQNLMIK